MATYFVDYVGGNDVNNGTTAGTPWQHCPWDQNDTGVAAATTLVPGDTVVYKGGVTYEGIHDSDGGGTALARITLQSGHAYSTPWGTGMAVINGQSYSDAIFEILHDYIDILDLEICYFANYGIAVNGCDYIRIKRNKVHDRKVGGSGGAEPILVKFSSHTEIEDNECYNSTWNGINVQSSEYTRIAYNDVHDNPLHGGINIISDTVTYYGMMNGNDVIGNYCHDNGDNGSLYSRYQRNCLIANNIFECSENSQAFNVYLAYGGAGGPTSYDASGCKIYNNTIIRGRWAICNDAALNVEWKNNIVVNYDIAATTTRYVVIYPDITGNVFDYNQYYGTADDWYWEGASATPFATWQSTSGQDAHGAWGDPLFGASFHLLGASPCVGAGATLAEVTDDYDGNPRPSGAGYDIGAFELTANPYVRAY